MASYCLLGCLGVHMPTDRSDVRYATPGAFRCTLTCPRPPFVPPPPPCVPALVRPQDPKVQGSILFSYVQTDEFCDTEELLKLITTSAYEEENLLYVKMLKDPKNRNKVGTGTGLRRAGPRWEQGQGRAGQGKLGPGQGRAG